MKKAIKATGPGVTTPAQNLINNQVVQAWIPLAADPKNVLAVHRFGELLHSVLLAIIPDSSRTGALKGLERDVRQEAYLRCLQYIAGNKKIRRAAKRNEIEKLKAEMARSIYAAIGLTQIRIASSVAECMKREVPFDPERDSPHELHPFSREMPQEARMKLALMALVKAVGEGLVTKSEELVVREQLEGGKSQAEIARQLGISRAAVHLRLARPQKILRVIVEQMEVQE